MSHLLTLIVAQTELTPTWGGLATQLGVAGAVAAILGWQLSLRVKELKDARDELREKDEKLYELATKALPVLSDATRVLADVARRHDDSEGTEALRLALRRVEDQLSDLGRRGSGTGGGRD